MAHPVSMGVQGGQLHLSRVIPAGYACGEGNHTMAFIIIRNSFKDGDCLANNFIQKRFRVLELP
jgi:hypothetical protein